MSYKTAEYDYEASSYDERRFYSEIGKHLDYMHKRIVERLLDFSAKLILDAGVGTGRFAVWLNLKGFEVIGVDVSTEMLKMAKKKAKAMNANISLILADLNFLPFRNESFDACICINVFDHLFTIDGFLKNVAYVLKANGHFIFNFSNVLSPYMPAALIVNFREKALFGGGKIRSKWFFFKQISTLLRQVRFDIKDVRGCMISSPLPLGNKLVRIAKIVNLLAESSSLKFYSGSIFIKAQSILNKISSKH